MRIFKEKTCVVCGAIFTPTSGAQKTCCKECAASLKKEYMKNYFKEKHSKPRKKAKSPFSETIKYAKEHDISYGEAVARMDAEKGVRTVVDNTPGARVSNDPFRNGEGYPDPTAYEALKRIESENAEDEKFNRLIKTIFSVATLAGFEIQGRITFVNKETGKIYK